MGFVLTLFEIAMQECGVGVIKSGLRAAATTTGEPAGQDQEGKAKSYGCVLPLEVTPPALTVPVPTQPISMLSILSVK